MRSLKSLNIELSLDMSYAMQPNQPEYLGDQSCHMTVTSIEILITPVSALDDSDNLMDKKSLLEFLSKRGCEIFTC